MAKKRADDAVFPGGPWGKGLVYNATTRLSAEALDRAVGEALEQSLELPEVVCLICMIAIPREVAYATPGRYRAFCDRHNTKANCELLRKALG